MFVQLPCYFHCFFFLLMFLFSFFTLCQTHSSLSCFTLRQGYPKNLMLRPWIFIFFKMLIFCPFVQAEMYMQWGCVEKNKMYIITLISSEQAASVRSLIHLSTQTSDAISGVLYTSSSCRFQRSWFISVSYLMAHWWCLRCININI